MGFRSGAYLGRKPGSGGPNGLAYGFAFMAAQIVGYDGAVGGGARKVQPRSWK